jgi:hypothetical protein
MNKDSEHIATFTSSGVTLAEASVAFRELAEAAAKAPFPEQRELRLLLLSAYQIRWGLFRFLQPGWWSLLLRR